MTTRILTEDAVSISEPAFYCIPAKTYEFMMDHIEDLELLAIVEQRKNEPSVKVNLNDL
jgi:antitoxin StbD